MKNTEALQLLGLIEKFIVKIISLIGWRLILVKRIENEMSLFF